MKGVELRASLAAGARRAWGGLRWVAARTPDWLRAGRRRARDAWRGERARRVRAGLGRARAATLRLLRAAAARRREALRVLLRVARPPAAAALCALLVLGAGRLLLHRVEAGAVGVRHSAWGGSGVTGRDFAPGLHWSLPGLDGWHSVPVGVRLVTWTLDPGPGERRLLEVRNKDGNLRVGVSVPWRVRDGDAHLLVRDGLLGTIERQATTRIEHALVEQLADVPHEELLDVERRRARMAAVLPRMNELLAPLHVEATAVLLESFFPPQEYEKKLQQRQLAEQEGRMAAAKSAVFEHEARLEEGERGIAVELDGIRHEWDERLVRAEEAAKDELQELERGPRRAAQQRRAAADAEHARLVAEGRRTLEEAGALRLELENEVLATEGGRLQLARTYAENLRFAEVTLDARDPDVPNVLDLDELTALVMGKSAGER